MKKVIILGSGIGGLAAGYYLTRTGAFQVTVLEKEPVIGGLCGSIAHDGCTLDYGAHKLYSVMPDILDDIRNLMGDRLIRIKKMNRLFLRNHLLDYPLRLGNLAKALGMGAFFHLGSGYALSLLHGMLSGGDPRSYEEYIVGRFGRPAYELVFEPLAEKVWGDPATLSPEMARTRVPASGGMDVILKLLGLKKETAESSADYFYYPCRGFGDFPLALRERIEAGGGEVRTDVAVTDLLRKDGGIAAVICREKGKQRSLPCDVLISSIPLHDIGDLVFRNTDPDFSQAVNALQFRHLILVYIFLKRSSVMEDQWIFFPEREFLFSRIFEQKRMNPELCPENQTAVCCDFTCTGDSPQWREKDAALAAKCVEGLIRSRFIQADDVLGHLVKRAENFYPRYDLHYEDRLDVVYDKIKGVKNLLLTGRIGMYNYNNADHCMDMGKTISEGLIRKNSCKEIIDDLIVRVRQYRIVD